jgi:hypothetical protein
LEAAVPPPPASQLQVAQELEVAQQVEVVQQLLRLRLQDLRQVIFVFSFLSLVCYFSYSLLCLHFAYSKPN